MIFAGSEISDRNWRRAAKNIVGALSVDILEDVPSYGECLRSVRCGGGKAGRVRRD